MTRLLIIGPGDMGAHMAFALGQSGRLDEIMIAGRPGGRAPEVAAVVASTCDVLARDEAVDGTDVGEVAALLERTRPDVVLQSATLLSPWPCSAATTRWRAPCAGRGSASRSRCSCPSSRP